MGFTGISHITSKGLAIDDTTFHWCPGLAPSRWPNTNEKVTSIRLFKAWQSDWDDSLRLKAWSALANSVDVLMGTQITCNETDDDRDWELVKQLLKLITPARTMGVAIGNEMELLFLKDYMQNAEGRH